MATSEALIKYYDCLKESFNKIQDKDNKTALINAALRPKIREEFDKSDKVLISYLNYIQVFSLIYSDKFAQICNNIIVPLFKENELTINENQVIDNNNIVDTENNNVKAAKIHETIKIVIKSKPELEDEFVNCVVKVFPGITAQTNPGESFKIFLNNCLEICTYLDEENLSILISKIFDKLNPPIVSTLESDELDQIKITLFDSYELMYKHIDRLKHDNNDKLDTFVTTISKVFVRDFISGSIEDHFKYLIIYIHSIDMKYSNLFMDLLWNTFLDLKRPIKDRRASVAFASAFISRASYVTLEQVIEYLNKTCKWCIETLKQYKINDEPNQSFGEDVVSSFYTLSHSIFYVITQRYREMYEHETIKKLLLLKLDRIIKSPLKPLEVCDPEIEERFKEVCSLYRIADLNSYDHQLSGTPKGSNSSTKRQKSENHNTRLIWKPIYREDGSFLPDRIKRVYNSYYHHKFFTITRDE